MPFLTNTSQEHEPEQLTLWLVRTDLSYCQRRR